LSRLATIRRPFAGDSYVESLDRARLSRQLERVRAYMLGVHWKTLAEIKFALEQLYYPTKFPEQSISARLRDLRKPTYLCRLERRRRGTGGTFEYQLLPAIPVRPQLALFVTEKVKKNDRRLPATTSEADDGEGRAAFFREARRVAGLSLDDDEDLRVTQSGQENHT
jgi:hypothetical protein